jgi:hypothetical protein
VKDANIDRRDFFTDNELLDDPYSYLVALRMLTRIRLSTLMTGAFPVQRLRRQLKWLAAVLGCHLE